MHRTGTTPILFIMKKKLCLFILLFLTVYILFCPGNVVAASRLGLVLWYEQILPALLPAAILSNILISSGYAGDLSGWLGKIFCFLPVGQNGMFVLFCGFLFGFPMGSKCSAQFLKSGQICEQEASVLFCIANNLSPSFIASYVLLQQLNLNDMFAASLFVLYAPALILGCVLLFRRQNIRCPYEKKAASRSQINFKIIDAGIMDGFETLVKIGGYIILFSILTFAVNQSSLPKALKFLLGCTLEVTNGIHLIAVSSLSLQIKYILAMAVVAFGGLSGIAQTSSMIKDTSLSMKKYCKVKLFLTLCSLILAIFAARLL